MFKIDDIDHFVIGISGGKDSTAALLYLRYEVKIPPEKIICIFTDTQNEEAATYQHIKFINDNIHPVTTIETEGFYELAKRKSRFPSTKARFCTQELKLEPAKRFMNSLEGTVVSVSGTRADESEARKNLKEFDGAFGGHSGHWTWRPLIAWTIEDVFLIHLRYKVPLNPLYGLGFSRVGCFPCIMSKKSEIRRIATLFPERIDLIRQAENETKKSGFSSFFSRKHVPERYRSKPITAKNGDEVNVPTIDDVVDWSRTTDHKHSSNYDFHFEDYETSDASVCMAGVCE